MSNSLDPNNWKQPVVANEHYEQLMREIRNPSQIPRHWGWLYNSLQHIPNITSYTFYDLGCGAGSTVFLLNQYGYGGVKYVGLDFSETMIRHSANWGAGEFHVEDFLTSDRDYTDQIIHCSGVIGLLPDPKDVLRKVLTFGASYVILNRETVEERPREIYVESSTSDLKYNQYVFSRNDFEHIIETCGYKVIYSIEKCYLLQKVSNYNNE